MLIFSITYAILAALAGYSRERHRAPVAAFLAIWSLMCLIFHFVIQARG